MSHIVTIDYEHLAIKCESICTVAEDALAELDKLIESLDSGATSLMSGTVDVKKQLSKERNSLANEIKLLKSRALEVGKRGKVDADPYYHPVTDTEIVDLANALHDKANDFLSTKLIEYQALLDSLLNQELTDNYQKRLDSSYIPASINNLLESIDDELLRQFTYVSYLKNNNLAGDELLAEGQRLMELMVNHTYEERAELERKRIRAQLEAHKIGNDRIDKIVKDKCSDKASLVQMQNAANKEIVDETFRKKTLKIIKQAIKERGFIIDNKNIKIDREKNVVNFAAIKLSGERADFKIFMDGKFIYDFHQGYKGMACQKDIEPFIKDLEDVYGMKITKSEVNWSNPDKISTMKYQQMKTNKNKG